jgi:tetratricopeptide (TPR) repeat protein
MLDQLVAANLLEPVDERAYRFHDLVRLHAAGVFDESEPPGARAEVIVRTLDWYLDAAITAGTAIRPYGRSAVPVVDPRPVSRRTFPDMNAALDWLDEEAPRLLSLVGYATRNGFQERGLQLTHQMWALFAYRKYYAVWREFDRLGLECARALGDTAGQARMLRRLGILHTETGDYDEATRFLRESAELWEGLGDRHRVATVHNSLGVVRLRAGDPAEAVIHLEQALDLHQRLGDVREASLVLVDLADALTDTGRPREAVDCLEQAWRHLSSSPDTFSRAHLRALLGRASAGIGRFSVAAGLLSEAETALQGVGSPSGQAEVYGYLGELAELTGRPDLARLHYRRAREILADLGVLDSGWLAARLRRLTPLSREVIGHDPSALP